MNVFETTFLGNPLWRWLLVIIITIAAYIVILKVKSIILKRLAPKVEKSKSKIDDAAILVVKKINWLFILIISIFIGSMFLALPENISKLIRSIIMVGLCLQIAIWGNELIKFWISGQGRSCDFAACCDTRGDTSRQPATWCSSACWRWC